MNTKLALALLILVSTALAASADETETLFDGSGIAGWDTARDPQRLDREFALSELAPLQTPPALAWRFVSKGVGFNDLFLRKPIERPFSRVRVLVRNVGEAVEFSAKVCDARGAEWSVPPVALASGGDWRWVEFPRDAWRVASWSHDADGRLDFPLAHFTIIAFGIQSGREYQLQIQRIELVRPDPPVATVLALEVPEHWAAGETIQAPIAFTLDRPCAADDARLILRSDRRILADFALPLPTRLSKLAPGRRIDLGRATFRVPQYVWGGTGTVELKLGEARVRYARSPPKATVAQRPTTRTVAEVKRHGGVPTLFINGRPHNAMAWATYSPTVEVFRDFSQAGVSLFTFSGTPTEAGYGLSKTVWVAPGEFDCTEFDQRVQMLLEANPQAYFFPRLYLHAPAWWSAQHPDDIVLMDPGDGHPVPLVHAGGKPAPSWASEAWRRDTVEGLRRLIAHIAAAPYADRVVGYHLASGTTEEWMMWGANEDQWVDYSPANLRAFRRWLEARYGTDQKLQAAWSDPTVTFATAAIPTKARRQAALMGALRDPAREQATIDFYRYNSELVADTIGFFAKAVKDLTRREKIVGVFYGYVLQLCGEQRQQNAGHLGLSQVLASPDVDFLASPTSYAFRQLGGEGTSHFMSLLGSVQLHDKLWFDENDIRTSLARGRVGQWGRPADVVGDCLQQDKELANCLVNGAAQWWFDVGANRYDDPTLMKRIAGLVANADAVLSRDRASVDEVAFVVDESSLCYLRVGDPLGNWLLLGQLPALHRIGAPVGHYLTSDLPRIGQHKLYLFPTSFAPSAADRRAIDALKGDGHVLVFLGAPGLYREGRIDEGGMVDLTGIRLKLSDQAVSLRVSLQPSVWSTIAPGETGSAPSPYGVDRRASPLVYAEDPQAIVLGTLADGRPGLVMRRYDDWTAVYSSAPLLPASLLRRLARRAGVHTYVDTEDVVWASHDLLAVSVHQSGPRTIHLPRPSAVTDLYEGSAITNRADSFPVDFPAHATRVFALQRPEPNAHEN